MTFYKCEIWTLNREGKTRSTRNVMLPKDAQHFIYDRVKNFSFFFIDLYQNYSHNTRYY